MEGPGCRASQGSGSPLLSFSLLSSPFLSSQPPAVWAPQSPGLPHIGTGPIAMRGGSAADCLEGVNCIKVTHLWMVCAQKVTIFNQENKKSIIFALLME